METVYEDHIDRHSERCGSRSGQGTDREADGLEGSGGPGPDGAQARLTEAYERSRWQRRVPSLPDILTYLMDQHELSHTGLIPLLGTASRVSEVLTGKRKLSMTMVKKLRERFHIPADVLIPPLRSSDIAA